MRSLLFAAAVTLAFPAANLLPATTASAFGKPEHSKIDAKVDKKGDELAFTFKVVPQGDMVINEEGPWKLELTKAENLSLPKSTFDKADIDFKLPGYAFNAKQSTHVMPKGGHMAEYKAIVFVCTKDKSKCFREVHNGEVRW